MLTEVLRAQARCVFVRHAGRTRARVASGRRVRMRGGCEAQLARK